MPQYREDVMEDLNRRSAMTLGLTVAAAVPLAVLPSAAGAEMYAADAGKEVMPGVRMVALGEWPVNFGGYKRAVANDYVMGPGTAFPEETMKNDMLCQIMEGEIVINQDGNISTAKTGHVYSCMVGTVETDKNEGTTAAIMRVIDLFPA